MPNSANQVPLQQYLAVVRRNRVMIVAIALLAAGLAVAFSVSSEKLYEAEATVAFNDTSQDLQALGTPAAPSLQPDKAAAAQATTITGPDVAARVRAALRLDATTAELQDAVSTAVQPASNLVAVTAEWDSAARAAAIANEFVRQARRVITGETRSRYEAAARTLRSRARRLTRPADAQARAALSDQASRLQALAQFSRPVALVRVAEAPDAPVSPRPVRNGILAGILGAMLGIGAAFLRQGLDRRIREAADVPADMGGPVLGYVRGEALGRGPVALTGRKAPKALDDDDLEPLRILRTNLGFLDPDGPLRTILVTSPLPEEGKSTVATSLAWLEAVGGRRTLLVDCDLRRPSVAQRFGVSPTPGLSDYLAGRASPAEILQTVAAPVGASPNGSEAPAEPQLVCIAAGTPAPNPAELLGSVRFRTFLAQVAEVYDRVVLDSPPLLPVGDTLELLPQVDGVLLCLRFGQTTRDQALAGRTALSHFPAKPTGIVLTGVRPGAESGDFGYYAYTHRYPATSAG